MSRDLGSRLRHPQVPEDRGRHPLTLKDGQQTQLAGKRCQQGRDEASHEASLFSLPLPLSQSQPELFSKHRTYSNVALLYSLRPPTRSVSSYPHKTSSVVKGCSPLPHFTDRKTQRYTQVIGFGCRAGKSAISQPLRALSVTHQGLYHPLASPIAKGNTFSVIINSPRSKILSPGLLKGREKPQKGLQEES